MAQNAHPINRLPAELIQEIFVQCTWLDQNGEELNLPFCDLAPLLLTFVCRTWRQLALHTPELWYRLSLDWTTRKLWSPALIGELWLSRCDSIPIMLSIHEYQDGYHPRNQGIDFAFKYATRISSLYLSHESNTRSLDGAEKFLQAQGVCFPMLKRLELRKFSGSFVAHLVSIDHFPELVQYKVDCVHSLLQNPGITFSHVVKTTRTLSSSLMHLDILDISMTERELPVIMNTFPSLSDIAFTLKLETGAQWPNDPPQTLTFATIRRLNIRFTRGHYFAEDIDDEGDVTSTLLRLSAPQLKALEVSYDADLRTTANYWIAHRVYKFLQYSQCALEELCIRNWACDKMFSGTRALELATSIPTLRRFTCLGTTLSAWSYCAQTHSVHHTQKPGSGNPLSLTEGDEWEVLPQLEELHCRIGGDTAVLEDVPDENSLKIPEMIAVIDQRMRSSSNRLKQCHVIVVTHYVEGLSKAVANMLASLSSLGLTYKIKMETLARVPGQRDLDAPRTERFGSLEYTFTPEEAWTAYPGVSATVAA